MIFKSVVLHSELLVRFLSSVHFEITVNSLLIRTLLLGRLHARGSLHPYTLTFVVSPVTSVSEWRNVQVKYEVIEKEG